MTDTPEPDAHRSAERRPPAWALIALVVVLTLVAIWLVPEDREAPAPPSAPKPEAETPSAVAPPPVRAEPPAAPPRAEAPAVEGDRARAFIASQRTGGEPDLAAAYAEAERLRADGALTDAWLIHFYAARLGHAPSALVLGTLSDPAYHEAGMGALDKPDPAQAVKWYGVAAAAGDGEAARRLENLRIRLEEAAAAGDLEAQRLLLQWR